MKIIYVHQHFRTLDMPGGTRSFEFARRMAQAGHNVHVVAGAPTNQAHGRRLWSSEGLDGFTVHWLNVGYRNEMSFWRRVLSFVMFATVATVRCLTLNHDVVFASSTPLTVAIPARVTSTLRRTRYVLEVRDVWPELPIALGYLRSRHLIALASALERWAYVAATEVVVLSPAMGDSITRRFPQVKVKVAPNGCDLDLFQDASEAGKQLRRRTAWLGDRPLVVYAGTLGEANGVTFLLDVAFHLADMVPRAQFAVIGDGKERAALDARVADSSVLRGRVHVLGPVTKREVVGWIGAANLCTSLFIENVALGANSPNKVFDALAAGRACALNHGGWISDVVVASGAGFRVPPNDPEAAACRIASFLMDNLEQERIGQSAIKLGRDRFDREEIAQRVIESVTAAIA